MPVPWPSVQPTTNLSRLVSGFAARRGASQTNKSDAARIALRYCALSLLCCTPFAPLSAAILPPPEVQASLIVNIACKGLVDDLPILVAETFQVEQPVIASVAPISAERLFPPFSIRFGTPPNLRRPHDWTAISMFGMGIFLFTLSWLIAAWNREPSTYRRPLYMGEQAPPPEPPHVIYSLTRNL